jgi:hypothetical protein
MEYLVIYEESAEGWGAYSPDLPGLRTGMRREGERIPVPSVPTAIMTVDIHA